MKRIILFIATNLLVVLAVSLIVNLLGLKPYLYSRGIDYESLLIFCAIWGFLGAFISLQLSRWTAKRAMGVQVIDADNPPDHESARIVELVRDLCRRAGLSHYPEIGIYDSPEVNAFATGPSQKRALLAISTGLLNSMDDRSVEGVIGHEVTHIANGDMVTMTLLQGIANTFVMFFARVIVFFLDNAMRSRDDNGRGRGGLGFFAQYMLIMLLESVLMLLASVVVYWFSRRREYAADAGSARMTGRETMIHALEQLQRATAVRDDRAPALSTFKINGHGRGLAAVLFASHPPIPDRIAALQRLS